MSAELRQLVCEIIADHPQITDQDKLAGLVADKTPADFLHKFYREALVLVVGEVLRTNRNTALNNALDASPSTPAQPKSAKMTARRTWWTRMLESQVLVAPGKRKFLGDCTIKDLQFCIDTRNQHIAAVAHQIEHYRRLQELLRKHKVATVKKLPPQQEWEAA
jgi:hypothetical protein